MTGLSQDWRSGAAAARLRALGFSLPAERRIPNSVTVHVDMVEAKERYVHVSLDEQSYPVATSLDWVRRNGNASLRPMREFTFRQNQSHFPGYYWARTTRGWIRCESRHEVLRAKIADFDHDVVWIYSQPFTVVADVRVGGRWLRRKQTPDFMLVLRDGSVRIVNVTIRERARSERGAVTNGWMRTVCEEAGYAFEVWVGTRAQFRENVTFLANFRQRLADISLTESAAAERLDDIVASLQDGDDIGSVVARHAASGSDRRRVLSLIWGGLWRHRLAADLGAPLHLHTPIRKGAAT